MRLLTVDWDFFFYSPYTAKEIRHEGDIWLYDWGHKESPFCMYQPIIWEHRASGFIRHGRELPGLEPGWLGFWDRFQFNDGADFFVAESHLYAGTEQVLDGVTDVINFDAHHDLGYDPNGNALTNHLRTGAITCDMWGVVPLIYGAFYTWIYPPWHAGPGEDHVRVFECVEDMGYDLGVLEDDGSIEFAPFDRLYVCRSAGWMPPWLDEQFDQFVEKAGIAINCNPENIGVDIPDREFDLERVKSQSYVLSDMMSFHKQRWEDANGE